MNILVLGGTQFVGRHIVEAFLAAGHGVSILTRGKSRDELPAAVERLHGDRNQGAAGLAALEGRLWDACVDVSGYTPQQVRASAARLQDQVRQYVFVSTVSVYAEPNRHPVREDDPLLPPAAEDVTEVTGETYGPLKVTCERIVQEVYGERCAILRPQIVAGPYDHTARYPYWVDRAGRGGEMLAPGDGSDHVQVIDARDLAKFTVKVVEEGLSGAYNLAGPRMTWAAFLEVLGVQSPRWVPQAALETQGLGHRELPLYLPEDSEQGGLMDVSPQRALAAGLPHTDPAVTARDTRLWIQGAGLRYALSSEREAEVLQALQE
ncbi:NAD-dependent epimerase/dehydratase family protein [Deinococcus hohokamensis]|uniref:NAD-dependent epimerase/dehydratase family protein n=1 Tax=Deinococcus hohokamensis TaxID=309883 RepID=A0ABV9ICP2_9DEIO